METKTEKNKDMGIADCSNLFLETMHEQFKDRVGDNGMLFAITANIDKGRFSSLCLGEEEAVMRGLCSAFAQDEELFELICKAICLTYEVKKRKETEHGNN